MLKTILRILVASVPLLHGSAPGIAGAQTRVLQPVGEYAQIDTRLMNETIGLLAKGSDQARRDRIRHIIKNPQDYAPPVFYVMSSVLFQSGHRDEAAFWFYAGQLRARFDANRCADVSARQAVAALNQRFGTPINEYMFKDLAKLEALIPKVVAWDEKTPYNYDHRWINLSGMNAVLASHGKGDADGAAPLSVSKEQWGQIAQRTRRDYFEGFGKALEAAKQMGGK